MRVGVKIDEKVKTTLKDAAQKLTGAKKRAFMAKATEDYFAGSARKAETYLGWKRQTVQKGLPEKRTGIICLDNYQARGRKKTEEKLPGLAADIHEFLEGSCQADPKLKTTFRYTKVTANAVLEALDSRERLRRNRIALSSDDGQCAQSARLPSKKTQKVKPLKKIPEPDAIFERVAEANQAADSDAKVLRLSIDSKAKVRIGNLSRRGKARTLEAKQADDHDDHWDAVLVT